ncbi:putative heat shock protein 67B2 [Trypanosoma rangeli]|uniref:Putative heat shock protein 67B2 n=1 Tax=Trypanosoma rangeli TaxID=5698 RepID=A0A3R7MT99_TRYRA|nr:putative heat shock protein 67B2 [Trypanosoma rangeli]RNF10876.1 putative heat shock protein 67B2 [Trypanosoma rangeli]|eukprot:RNF10876.1 putative heat shock protein 67B2 [Trypanosoma rangeli]
MGQDMSFEKFEKKKVMDLFEMEALVKSKREGKNKDVFIVDVRDNFEVEEHGSIPFSLHIPSSELRRAFRLNEAEFMGKYKSRMPRKSDKIVFYDQRSGRAATAVEVVESMGYQMATHFSEGFNGWEAKSGRTAEEDL